MKRCFLMFSVAAVAVVLAVSMSALAAPFDATFKIDKTTGECMVKAPGAADYAAAEQGKSYPYGTEIKTGANSSALVLLSEGNQVALLANTILTITEKKDKTQKCVQLNEGVVDVSLEKDFQKSNGFEVETATAICGAIGTKLRVGSRTDEAKSWKVALFNCKDGKIRIGGGKYFGVPLMKSDDVFTAARAVDGSFISLENVAGDYDVEAIGPDGSPRTIKTSKGTTIKIHLKKAEKGEKFLVTVVIAGIPGKPDKESWTVEIGGEEPGKEEPGKEEAGKEEPAKKTEELQPSEMPKMSTTTTTIPVLTTTTTIPHARTPPPSPTPVGRR